MEIKDFKGLTNFVNEEADKFFETYGEKLVVGKLVDSLIKNLVFYFKLEAGYLQRKEKRELKLKEAIETMPHGFIWKIFHLTLWAQIKAIKKEEEEVKQIKREEQTKEKEESVIKRLEPVTAVVTVKQEPVVEIEETI